MLFFETKTPVPSFGVELTVWKYVVIIGVVAVVIFYLVKRIGEYVSNKKTEKIIKEHGEDQLNDRKEE